MRYNILFVFLFIFSCALAQNEENTCNTLDSEEGTFRKKSHFGNNEGLLKVLKKRGFELPVDYFDELDDRGLYKGKRLKMRNVRPPKNRREKINNGKKPNGAGRSTSVASTTYIPLFIWNHADANGNTSWSMGDIEFVFSGMAAQYREETGGAIEFYISTITVLNNSPYFTKDNNDYSLLNYRKDEDNSITVHLIQDGGNAADIGGNAMYMETKVVSTFSHELGHNLNLEHTHRGNGWNCGDNNEQCNNCNQEPVSRTMGRCFSIDNKKRCAVNGDGLCDTAGEPNLGGLVAAGCVFQPNNSDTRTDNWGVPWSPNLRNIMSYSRRSCRNEFTYGQIGVMMDELEKNRWDFTHTTAGNVISGPRNVCPGQSYTYSAPNLTGISSYQWQVPEGWSISGNGNRVVTITPVENFEDPLIYVSAIPDFTQPVFNNSGQITGAVRNGASISHAFINVAKRTTTITGSSTIPEVGVCYSFHSNIPGATYYNWSTSSPSAVICGGQGNSTVSVRLNSSVSSFYLNVSSVICGKTTTGSKLIRLNANGGPIRKEQTTESSAIDESEVLVYPNPVTDIFTISVPVHKELSNLTISNISGQTLLSQDRVFGIEEFDISGFGKGLYLIRYYDPEQGFVAKKIVKK